jgi:MFS family permease
MQTWRKLPRNVWIVTITSFLTDISSEMVFNLLPLFLSNVLGVKTNIIGVIEGVAETTASLLKIFSGWLSDKLGQRKRLAVLGYGLSTISKPFLYVVGSWGGVLAVRFSDRVGKGIRTAPRDALIADTIDEDHRGAAFGLHRAGDTAGAALGILIALGVVLVHQSSDIHLERSTFRVIVLISVIPAVLAVVALAWGAHDVPIATRREAPRLTLRGFDRRFQWFLLAISIFTLGNSADAFLILLAQDRGLNVAGVLGMLLTFNIVYAALSGPAGALSDRIGRSKLIIATEGTAKALVADLVGAEQRGTAYGVYNAAVGIMALPASVIAGVLWQGAFGWNGFGASAPFLFGAAMALAALGLFVSTQRRDL